MTVTLCFYARFSASKVGLDGLTVTWDIDRITRSDGTRTALVTGGATNVTFGRRGLYGYRLTGADTTLYDYIATAITTDATVDFKEINAGWFEWGIDTYNEVTNGTYGLAQLLRTSAYTAPDNSGITAIKAKTDNLPASPAATGAAMTLTSAYDAAKTAASQSSVNAIATILDGITSLANWLRAFARKSTPDATALSEINNGGGGYDATTDSLQAQVDNATGGATPAELWSYAERTLTSPTAATADGLVAGELVASRATTWVLPITGLGDLSDRTKLYVTAKHKENEADADAVLQWEETAGLLRLNGDTTTSNYGSVTVDDEDAGDITIRLKPAASKDVTPGELVVDVKKIVGTDAYKVGAATLTVLPIVTRAVG
jgi:hypothetical protein